MKVYVVMKDFEYTDEDVDYDAGTEYVGVVGSVNEVARLISDDIKDVTKGELTVKDLKRDSWLLNTADELKYHFSPYRDERFVNVARRRASMSAIIGTLTYYKDVDDTFYESNTTYYYYEGEV